MYLQPSSLEVARPRSPATLRLFAFSGKAPGVADRMCADVARDASSARLARLAVQPFQLVEGWVAAWFVA